MRIYYLKSKVFKITAILLAITLFSLYLPPILEVGAGNLTNLKDTMTRLQTSTTSNHTIQFVPTQTTPAGGGVRIEFDSGFDLGSLVYSDVTMNDGTTSFTATTTSACSSANQFYFATSTGPVVTLKLCTGATLANATTTITIANNRITNPSTSGSKTITLKTCTDDPATCSTIRDSGKLAVAITSFDQVTISATVDPTITFTISANSANLGTLTTSAVSTATITATTTTNASGGYSATILEDGNLRSGVNDINDVADGIVSAGSEEYGVSTTDSGQEISQETGACDGNPASPITSSAQTFAGSTGPATEGVTLCFAASITGTTPAGSYSHIITLISTGTF